MSHRHLIRALHLIAAAIIGTFIYSPWGAIPGFSVVIQVVAFPALALSGLTLWLLPRLRFGLRARRTR